MTTVSSRHTRVFALFFSFSSVRIFSSPSQKNPFFLLVGGRHKERKEKTHKIQKKNFLNAYPHQKTIITIIMNMQRLNNQAYAYIKASRPDEAIPLLTTALREVHKSAANLRPKDLATHGLSETKRMRNDAMMSSCPSSPQSQSLPPLTSNSSQDELMEDCQSDLSPDGPHIQLGGDCASRQLSVGDTSQSRFYVCDEPKILPFVCAEIYQDDSSAIAAFSFVIMFNLALAYHMCAVREATMNNKTTTTTTQGLETARKLYELSLQMQMEQQMTDPSTTVALLNNLSVVCKLLGDEAAGRHLDQSLSSLVLYMIDVGVNQQEKPDIEGCFGNIMYLFMDPPCTATAA